MTANGSAAFGAARNDDGSITRAEVAELLGSWAVDDFAIDKQLYRFHLDIDDASKSSGATQRRSALREPECRSAVRNAAKLTNSGEDQSTVCLPSLVPVAMLRLSKEHFSLLVCERLAAPRH